MQFCAIVSWNQALEYYGYSPQDRPEQAELIEGAALRGFCELLDDVDKEDYWGGLQKIFTPEGHYLWVCEEHAKEYRV